MEGNKIMTPTDSEIYEQAARILAEKGHCKRILVDNKGRRCALGALMDVADGEASWARIVERADIKAQARGDYRTVVDYNNADETTGEDVIQLFKELAHETAGI